MPETKYYPPRARPDGTLSHGSIEAWTTYPNAREVFLVARPGESQCSLERRALVALTIEH